MMKKLGNLKKYYENINASIKSKPYLQESTVIKKLFKMLQNLKENDYTDLMTGYYFCKFAEKIADIDDYFSRL